MLSWYNDESGVNSLKNGLISISPEKVSFDFEGLSKLDEREINFYIVAIQAPFKKRGYAPIKLFKKD